MAAESPGQPDQRLSVGNRKLAIAAACTLALGLTLTGARIVKKYQSPGPFDENNQGFCDFHNGIYFPTLAVLSGESPYGPEYAAEYPVARQIPFFSPVILVLHAPLAVMPLRVAEILFFMLSVTILLAIGVVCAAAAKMPGRMDVILAVAAGLVFTRGGHITLFDGYFTFELILATILAVHWADRRPIAAALALTIVSAKPTYILPLGFLMLARGNYKALVIGALFSIIAAALPLTWLAYHEGDGNVSAGARTLVEHIQTAQEIHLAMPDETPVVSWTRLDLLAVVAKWTGSDPGQWTHLLVMAAILLVPVILLVRRQKQGIDDGVAGMTGALILTAMLVSLYHQSYDAMLVVAPVVGLLLAKIDVWSSLAMWQQKLTVLLMLIPLGNFFSTRMALGGFDHEDLLVKVATSVNGIVLALLLVLLCWLAIRSAADIPNNSGNG